MKRGTGTECAIRRGRARSANADGAPRAPREARATCTDARCWLPLRVCQTVRDACGRDAHRQAGPGGPKPLARRRERGRALQAGARPAPKKKPAPDAACAQGSGGGADASGCAQADAAVFWMRSFASFGLVRDLELSDRRPHFRAGRLGKLSKLLKTVGAQFVGHLRDDPFRICVFCLKYCLERLVDGR